MLSIYPQIQCQECMIDLLLVAVHVRWLVDSLLAQEMWSIQDVGFKLMRCHAKDDYRISILCLQ